uniref:Neuropeptide Y prohormone-11 n=1 Tax=Schmidtea mediterranea TaxID=79327 RepID=E3CTJ6_SCHMD|nr:TPA_inf: neuropeptide Y prohormone-11 [Schmidtea mediterranea]
MLIPCLLGALIFAIQDSHCYFIMPSNSMDPNKPPIPLNSHATSDEIKDYLHHLNLYFQIVSRPRLGKRQKYDFHDILNQF